MYSLINWSAFCSYSIYLDLRTSLTIRAEDSGV